MFKGLYYCGEGMNINSENAVNNFFISRDACNRLCK